MIVPPTESQIPMGASKLHYTNVNTYFSQTHPKKSNGVSSQEIVYCLHYV
jgi:hypothetical protein